MSVVERLAWPITAWASVGPCGALRGRRRRGAACGGRSSPGSSFGRPPSSPAARSPDTRRGGGVVAPGAVASRVAEPLRRQHVLVVRDACVSSAASSARPGWRAAGLLHTPPVEADQDRTVLRLRVGVTPAAERPLDVFAVGVTRIAVVDVLAVFCERAAVFAHGAWGVDAPFGALVVDVRGRHGPSRTTLVAHAAARRETPAPVRPRAGSPRAADPPNVAWSVRAGASRRPPPSNQGARPAFGCRVRGCARPSRTRSLPEP